MMGRGGEVGGIVPARRPTTTAAACLSPVSVNSRHCNGLAHHFVLHHGLVLMRVDRGGR